MISFVVSFPCRRRSVVAAALLLATPWLSALVGCAEVDDVQVYEVDRKLEDKRREVVFGEKPTDGRAPRAPASVAAVGEPGRLIGVLLSHADDTWFFKLLGPDEAVKKHVEEVKTFITAVKFDKGQPVWNVPAGWKEQPSTDGVTLVFFALDSADPKLRLAVSRFPGQQDLTANVNRWRGQLKLAPVDAEEAAKGAIPLDTAAGKALWVELTGTFSGAGGMGPMRGGMGMGGAPVGPMAGPINPNAPLPADHPPLGAALPKGPAAGGPVPPAPFKYDLPTGWTPSPAGQINMAAFTVVDGSDSARVTVSEAGGSLLSNIDRWRGQLGLPPTDEAQLENALTKLKVAGSDADFIELIAPAGAGPQGAILGVIIKKSDTSSYFIKLTGSAPIAQRERERFMQFVGSIRFDR